MADTYINADTADIPSVNFAQQGSDPTTPAASRWQLYFKSGGLYARKSDGTVVGPFGIGGGVASDPIWDTAGDLAVGTGADTAAKLAIGTPYQQLRVNAGATALEYVTGGLIRLGRGVAGVGGVASVTFTAIPGIFSSLFLTAVGRGSALQSGVGLVLQFNGDSGNNYDLEVVLGTGAAASAAEALAQAQLEIGVLPAASDTASKAGAVTVEIPEYAGTTFHKMTLGLLTHQLATTSGNMRIRHYGGLWRSTAAITDILVYPFTGNLVEGSAVTLWGRV